MNAILVEERQQVVLRQVVTILGVIVILVAATNALVEADCRVPQHVKVRHLALVILSFHCNHVNWILVNCEGLSQVVELWIKLLAEGAAG